jgi:phospholipase D1/2
MDAQQSLLEVGRSCWRKAHAERVAFLIDAEAYFDVLVQALRHAKHTVHLVGWDIHSRTPLKPQGGNLEGERLGEVLTGLVEQNPDLDVRVLIWDYAPIFAMERELGALQRLALASNGRIKVEWAKDHPKGGAHHQKILVIDDALAFTGGIELTINRWDTREHRVPEPSRILPDGDTYDPFHDVHLAVDGEAAAALGEVVRERWRSATGEDVPAPPHTEVTWPEGLAPNLEHVELGIARTMPELEDRPAVLEIERLFKRAIASAKHTLYCESQYLTSTCIADAISERLKEPDGPEVLLLTPNEQHGIWERLTMGVRRNGIVKQMREADLHGRLRVLCPAIFDGGKTTWVHVHSKVMVVDDELLIIGSANLANRSMTFDSELSLAFEAKGDPKLGEVFTTLRDDLVAEHCGVSLDEVRASIEKHGSLRGAVDELRSERKALLPVTFETEPSPETLEPLADVVDATRPVDEAFVRRAMPREAVAESRRRLPWSLLPVVLLLGLAGAWAWTPLATWVEPQAIAKFVEPLRVHPFGPVLWAALFVFASVLMVPVTALIVVTVMLFGSGVGFVTAMSGSLLGALASYGLGRVLLKQTVRRFSGPRIDRLTRRLTKRGWLAIAVVRCLPVAPFAVVNLVAGSTHIRLRDFMLGTFIGMAPGALVLSLAAERVVLALRNPSPATIALAVTVIIGSGILLWALTKLLDRAWRPGPSEAT